MKIKIGTIKTQHAAMNLTYAGLESLLLEDLQKVAYGEQVDDNMSMNSKATDASCFRGTKPATPGVSGGDMLASKLSKSLVLTPPTENDTAAVLARVREYM